MVRDTTLYYDQMSSTVSRALRNMWEAEITRAESQQLRNPSVMDIIGAQEIHKARDPNPTQSGRTQTDLQWLDLALSIEERQ